MAWATRDIISKVGGWNKLDQPVREKLAYQKFVQGDSNELTINGKTYYAHEVYGTKASADLRVKSMEKSKKEQLKARLLDQESGVTGHRIN